MMVPSEDSGDVLVRRHSLPNPPASQKEDSTRFPSAPPPARTVLCFAGQPVLCRTACIVPDSLYCAGQPVLLPQQVHQRCVPSLMVVKMMTRKLFHLPQQYSLFVVVVTSDEHVIVVFIVVLSLESI